MAPIFAHVFKKVLFGQSVVLMKIHSEIFAGRISFVLRQFLWRNN